MKNFLGLNKGDILEVMESDIETLIGVRYVVANDVGKLVRTKGTGWLHIDKFDNRGNYYTPGGSKLQLVYAAPAPTKVEEPKVVTPKVISTKARAYRARLYKAVEGPTLKALFESGLSNTEIAKFLQQMLGLKVTRQNVYYWRQINGF